MTSRRTFLLASLLLPCVGSPVRASGDGLPDYPVVVPGYVLQFPADYGAHPAYRTEWWYVTGWIQAQGGPSTGFQVTFFRSRPPLDERDPSRFAPRELLFAHAALADPAVGHLLHDQRAARAGFGLAQAATGDTNVHIGDWSLARQPDGTYHGLIPADPFALDLAFRPTQPVLIEGVGGYSRKGPLAAQASYYYSQPQLAVAGTVTRDGHPKAVTGSAWLDHEWSSEVLAADAAGWDWTGVNLADGGALMAFRIRDAAGKPLWAGGSWRRADGQVTILGPADVAFEPQRRWESPRTGATYPVAMELRAGPLRLQLQPLMDDQELDSRASTGTVYWEGAVTARRDGHVLGRGYLELTGYLQPLAL